MKRLNGSFKNRLAAVVYLCKVSKKFRMINKGNGVSIIESYGKTGWCSQGSYNEWSQYLYIDQKINHCDKMSPPPQIRSALS